MYCYFTSRSNDPKAKIQWAIHPLGAPFHAKRNLNSLDNILRLVGIQSASDVVRNAIVSGLSGQYFSQVRFENDAPVYMNAEPTPEEQLAAWEDHSLDISEGGNMDKVQEAIMATFGIYVTKDEVELLTRFSILSKVSPFETNTWRHILCYRCCPKKDTPPCIPAAVPVSRKENLLKRKKVDREEVKDEPTSKRASPPATQTAASSTALSTTTSSSRPLKPPVLGIPLALPFFPNESIFPTLSRNLILASWLRLLPSLPLHGEKTLTTIQGWLKKYFEIDARWEDITKITTSAKKERISPLQTAVFKCMVATARQDVAGILMNPYLPTAPEKARRESLRVFSGQVDAALRMGSGSRDEVYRN